MTDWTAYFEELDEAKRRWKRRVEIRNIRSSSAIVAIETRRKRGDFKEAAPSTRKQRPTYRRLGIGT